MLYLLSLHTLANVIRTASIKLYQKKHLHNFRYSLELPGLDYNNVRIRREVAQLSLNYIQLSLITHLICSFLSLMEDINVSIVMTLI